MTCTNMGDCPLRLTVWQDRRSIFGHLTRPSVKDLNDATGNWLTMQPKIRPNHLSWFTYDSTDKLQAPGIVVMCFLTDPISPSAMTRYVIREYRQEQILKQTPALGEALHLARSSQAP